MFIPEAMRLIRSETPIIFDIGCNVGDVIIEAKAKWPKATVHAFEPDLLALDECRTRLSDLTDVHLHEMALGASEGSAVLHTYTQTAINSVLPMHPQDRYTEGEVRERGTRTVTVTSLDTFCARFDIRQIDFLKIDTQGYDLEVLKGAHDLLSRRAIGGLIAEVLFVPCYAGQSWQWEIAAFLSAHEYRLHSLFEVSLTATGEAKWGNVLYAPSIE